MSPGLRLGSTECASPSLLCLSNRSPFMRLILHYAFDHTVPPVSFSLFSSQFSLRLKFVSLSHPFIAQ